MNERENLIVLKDQVKTSEVQFIRYNPSTKKYDVRFSGENVFHYSYNSVQWYRNPTRLAPEHYQISKDGKVFFDVQEIYDFDGIYWSLFFSHGSAKTYLKSELSIRKSCLGEKDTRATFAYLKEIAGINELKNDDGDVLLQKQYDSLKFVSIESALAVFLNPQQNKIRKMSESALIFPFGGNTSQFQAVRNAMQNQLSVIQGPPGTGKTQTILNIIANLLVQGKTIQVVSNNNSATQNVLEKLSSPKYNMGFLVATLGKKENKGAFIKNQSLFYPDLRTWRKSGEEMTSLQQKIAERSTEMAECFDKQELLARDKQELAELDTESRYFEQYCKETDPVAPSRKPRKGLKSRRILQALQETERASERGDTLSVLQKLKYSMWDGICEWAYLNSDLADIINYLQSLFYTTRHHELETEIHDLSEYLSQINAKSKMDELTSWSMEYLRAVLYVRYGKRTTRQVFQDNCFWREPGEVLNEYPIILSTTFSSRSSLKDVTYDYLIMDEASQVDVATGALALAGAKNAVIVGDLKQLPNVIPEAMRKVSQEVFERYRLPEGYSFADNSFLKSVCAVIPDLPQTLLREHYRCHPKIIGFCNQKFYHNELVVMTEDHDEPDALRVVRTTVGDHHRGRVNQRQIDVTVQEVLPKYADTPPSQIGIISPYRAQVRAVANAVDGKGIEVDTVHKFQGREKDVIVLTTADDVVTDFSDDPYLLNVAISRAKKKLCLVVSGSEQPEDSNIRDLIFYIEYNNYEVLDSELYSVFDMLYQQYTRQRMEFLEKHKKVSEYDSENLMYAALSDLLKKYESLPYSIICHQSLRLLIRDFDKLTEEEYRYACHPNTHIDFLIYNRISKTPVLAIEVDGFNFHKEGTAQAVRDRMKDAILEKYSIPLIRLPTNSSREIEKIEAYLQVKK